MLDSMWYFVAIDLEGRITYIGKKYAALYNSTPEELIGRPVESVIHNTRLNLVLQKRENEIGRFMTSDIPNQSLSAPISSVCNRLLIYRNGDEAAGEVMGAMAYGIITSDQDIRHLPGEIDVLRKQNQMYKEHIAQMYQASYDVTEILGNSAAITAMKQLIRRVANTSISICILGETGVGKELVANAIHSLSKRKDKPFVKINCAAIPKDLIESELFGYEGGAFTGASRQGKIGMFELANNGTLLLDEIGELPLNLQVKLLRILQEGEFYRVGGTVPVPVNVRLICSTNRNLKQMVQDGLFRADLYYRVNTMEIKVPPLRERLEDLPILSAHFIQKANLRNELSVTGVGTQAQQLLMGYSWPGNVRELEHCIERACVLCGRGQLEPVHFTAITDQMTGAGPSTPLQEDAASLRFQNDAAEKEAILNALECCRGSRSAAAKLLNISRATLYNKLKKYGIR